MLQGFAERSQTAYETEDVIRSKFPATTRVADPGTTDGRYFLEVDQKKRTQTITIRGTASKIDIHDDIEMKIREDRLIAIPVHAGFELTTMAIYADVKPYLKPGYTTYLTGHSLGGAVAALLAVYLIEDGIRLSRWLRSASQSSPRRRGSRNWLRCQSPGSWTRTISFRCCRPSHSATGSSECMSMSGPSSYCWRDPAIPFSKATMPTAFRSANSLAHLRIAELKDHHMDNYVRRLSSKVGAGVEVPYQDREKYVALKASAPAATSN